MVTLISPLAVDSADEKEFLSGWKNLLEWLRSKDGFRAARLQRSVSSSAPFRFIGMSMWDSQAAITAALDDPRFLELSDAIPVRISPTVYEIIEEVTGNA